MGGGLGRALMDKAKGCWELSLVLTPHGLLLSQQLLSKGQPVSVLTCP